VDQAAKIEVAQVNLEWQHEDELLISRWACDTSCRQRRDATHRWDLGFDLTMASFAQVIQEHETYTAIKQAK